MYMHIYTHTYVCMYIYIHTHTHTCTHTHTHTQDATMERDYMDSQMQSHMHGITSGLFLHTCAAIWQMQTILWPDYPAYFKAHGSLDLEGRIGVVTVLLITNALLATLASAAVTVFLRSRMTRLRRHARDGAARAPDHMQVDLSWREFYKIGVVFAALKLAFLAISIAAYSQWPSRGVVLVGFATEVTTNFGMSACNFGVSYVLNLALVLLSLALAVPSLFLHLDPRRDEIPIISLIYITGMSVMSVMLSRIFCHQQRMLWLRVREGESELKLLQHTLVDLLPKDYLRRIINVSQSLQPEMCTVVALQLDICDFSALGAQMEGVELAQTIHELFSQFDHLVMGRGLTKLDTIGDAYIVVGFLRDQQGTESQGTDSDSDADMRCCADMLEVGTAILHSISSFRTKQVAESECVYTYRYRCYIDRWMDG